MKQGVTGGEERLWDPVGHETGPMTMGPSQIESCGMGDPWDRGGHH